MSRVGRGIRWSIIAVLITGGTAAGFLLFDNTRFAGVDTRAAFEALQPGTPRAEVHARLGEPLGSKSVTPRLPQWLYSDDPQPEFEENGIVKGRYLWIEFDRDGDTVRQAYEDHGGADGDSGLRTVGIHDDLIGLSKAGLIEKRGEPDHVWIDRGHRIERFSEPMFVIPLLGFRAFEVIFDENDEIFRTRIQRRRN